MKRIEIPITVSKTEASLYRRRLALKFGKPAPKKEYNNVLYFNSHRVTGLLITDV